MRVVFLISVLMMLSCSGISAQETMSLPQLISYAHSHNLTLQRGQNQLIGANYDLQRTRANLLPTLNGSASHNYNFGRSIDRTTNQYSTQTLQNNYFSLNSDVILFGGLQKINQIRQAQWTKTSDIDNVQRIKDDISLTVANYYLQILLAMEREKQLNNQLERTRAVASRNKVLYNAGAVAQTKILESDAQIATDEVNLIDVQNQMNNTYLQLKQYINYDLEKKLIVEPVAISEPTVVYTEADRDKVFAERIKEIPAVKSAAEASKSYEYALKSYIGSRLPSLHLNGSVTSVYSSAGRSYEGANITNYQTIGYTSSGESVISPVLTPIFANTPFNTQLKNNFGQSLGLTLSIPILNNFQSRYSIQQSRIALDNSNVGVREAELKAKYDASLAFQNMQQSRRKYMAAQTKRKSQEALYSNTEKSYQAGITSYFDYNTSKSNLNTSQSEELQSKFEYIFQMKTFEYYLGKGISL